MSHKAAVIIAPIIGTSDWQVICINGRMKYFCIERCDSREDAETAARGMRKHWRRLGNLIVCNKITP